MKFASVLAIGVSLTLGASATLLPSPALAAKKEKAPAAPTIQLSKEVRAALAASQTAIKAGDFATAETQINAAEAASKTPTEVYTTAQIRLELGLVKKDLAIQSKAVYAMINSGGAPAADLPKLNFYAGNFAYSAGNYPLAIKHHSEAERLGYQGSEAVIQMAESYFKSNQPQPGLAALERAIAAEAKAGRKAPESWYTRGASVALKGKANADIVKWTGDLVKAYPTDKNWRTALVLYRDTLTQDGQQVLDVYRLMRLTKAIAGERDFYEYAATSNERGLPGEAKSVIEEGFASGAINRNSRPISEMLTLVSGRIAGDRATLAASERQAAGAANGRVGANTGDAYLAYGEDAKAIALYKAALAKGGVDTDMVNTRLGIALTRTGQKEEARQAFAKVSGVRKNLAQYWLLYLDVTA